MRGDAAAELERLRSALDVAGLGVWDWDVASGRCHVTPALLALLGLEGGAAGTPATLDELRGRVHPDDRARVAAALRELVDGRSPAHRCDYRALHRDGRWVWLEERARVVARDGAGSARRVVGTCADVTSRMATLHGATWLALHDALTSLPNRALFARHLARAGAGPGVGVLVLDLDRFKLVNDRHGHLAGDRLLVQVAGRLRHSVRRADVVARLGGDEFAVLVAGPHPAAPSAVARRIIGRLRDEPFVVDGAPARVSASGGLAERADTAGDDALLRRADAALYAAKAAGGACWRRWRDASAAARGAGAKLQG